jgi:hypothetical protein
MQRLGLSFARVPQVGIPAKPALMLASGGFLLLTDGSRLELANA